MSIASVISSSRSVTTQVRMRLACQGLNVIVNQLGAAFAIVTAEASIPPGPAVLSNFVDADQFDQIVNLPDGIQPGQTRIRIVPTSDMTRI
jgi:hypothetical protein